MKPSSMWDHGMRAYLAKHIFAYLILSSFFFLGAWMWDRSLIMESLIQCQAGYHDFSQSTSFKQASALATAGLIILCMGLIGIVLFYTHYAFFSHRSSG